MLQPLIVFVQEWKDIWLHAGRTGVDAGQAACWILRPGPVARPLDAINDRYREQSMMSETRERELLNDVLFILIG